MHISKRLFSNSRYSKKSSSFFLAKKFCNKSQEGNLEAAVADLQKLTEKRNRWSKIDGEDIGEAEELEFGKSARVVKKLEGRIAELKPEEIDKRKAFIAVSSRVNGQAVINYNLIQEFGNPVWYDDVAVVEVPENGKWTIHLDGCPLITRDKKGFFVTKEQAILVASEWESQEKYISLAKMPMMQEMCGALDDSEKFRSFHVDELVHEYTNTDHMLFNFPESTGIYNFQQKLFKPVLEWFKENIGLELNSTFGYIQKHPQQTKDRYHVLFVNMDPTTFILFSKLANYTKSLILTIALWHNAISIEDALAIVRFEEDYQETRNGSVPAGQDYHACVAYIDLATCCLLLQASSIEPPTKASFEAYGDCGLILMEHQLKSLVEELDVYKGMHKSLQDNREADKKKREAEKESELKEVKEENNTAVDEKEAEKPAEEGGGFDMNAQVLDEMERVYLLEINNKLGEIDTLKKRIEQRKITGYDTVEETSETTQDDDYDDYETVTPIHHKNE